MLKPCNDPQGYKKLLAYRKADELQTVCLGLTKLFPYDKTLHDLADQMNRSARSGKQNIVEGWKRNTTKEYYDFLGFSLGAVSELEEDCDDIIKGKYARLMGIKGLMGERGSPPHQYPASASIYAPSDSRYPHSSPSTLSSPFVFSEVEKLKFYPLDNALPPVIQLKLRAKELGFLLEKLQKSLAVKMDEEGTMPRKDRLIVQFRQEKSQEEALNDIFRMQGLVRLENGLLAKKNEISPDTKLWPGWKL